MKIISTKEYQRLKDIEEKQNIQYKFALSKKECENLLEKLENKEGSE